MPDGRITKQTVDRLQCPTGKDRIFCWDNDLSGFGVAAFPTGRKTYVVQFRRNGRTQRVKIGDHGRLTPTEARTQAKIMLGAVETGINPIADRRAARAVRTFNEVAKDFLASHVATKRKGRTGEEYDAILTNHIIPAIGSRRITDLRRADVSRLHSRLSNRPFLANRALAIISAIWNWAAKRDEVNLADNPAKGIERYPEKARERFLTKDELTRLGAAMVEAETTGLPWNINENKAQSKHLPTSKNRRVILDQFAIAAVRLLILTGARLREILEAKWQDVDFQRSILFLPDSKGGKRPIYLSAAAQVVLSALPRVKGNPYIIVGSKKNTPRADLKKALGYPETSRFS